MIVHPEDRGLWSDPCFGEKEPVTALLKPYSTEGMEAYPVSRRVTRPADDEPSCVEPAA